MLPDFVFDWWFSPWAYAPALPDSLPAADLLGQRDSYRLWCEKAGVVSAFPEQFDPGWHVAISDSPDLLIASARLFAGLFAARTHDQQVLAQLPLADRKWCMSIAITQPLTACRQVSFTAEDTPEVRGLVELARRLENDFPGLWSRLRLVLPTALAERVDVLVQEALALNESAGTSSTRAQRCWTLCRNQAANAPVSSAPPAWSYTAPQAADEMAEETMEMAEAAA